MYTELSEIEEAAGKTVQSIARALFGDQMVVAFTDETFIVFGIERGYESCDDAILPKELDLRSFGVANLVGSGIITQEEFDQQMEEQREERRRGREEAERKQLARLKAKFEGG